MAQSALPHPGPATPGVSGWMPTSADIQALQPTSSFLEDYHAWLSSLGPLNDKGEPADVPHPPTPNTAPERPAPAGIVDTDDNDTAMAIDPADLRQPMDVWHNKPLKPILLPYQNAPQSQKRQSTATNLNQPRHIAQTMIPDISEPVVSEAIITPESIDAPIAANTLYPEHKLDRLSLMGIHTQVNRLSDDELLQWQLHPSWAHQRASADSETFTTKPQPVMLKPLEPIEALAYASNTTKVVVSDVVDDSQRTPTVSSHGILISESYLGERSSSDVLVTPSIESIKGSSMVDLSSYKDLTKPPVASSTQAGVADVLEPRMDYSSVAGTSSRPTTSYRGTTDFTPQGQAVEFIPEMEAVYSENVKTLIRLVNDLPEGVNKQTGAQIIRLTMEAMGISMENVLNEAQGVQSQMMDAMRSNIKKIEEYKTIIWKLESEIRYHQAKANELSEIIDLFILPASNSPFKKEEVI